MWRGPLPQPNKHCRAERRSALGERGSASLTALSLPKGRSPLLAFVT